MPPRKHGQSHLNLTPTYRSWVKMLARCRDPKGPYWHRYGGRGISVCTRWMGEDGFTNFLADMGERPAGKTLDRKDNDKDYSPDNCRWATAKEQRANQGLRRNGPRPVLELVHSAGWRAEPHRWRLFRVTDERGVDRGVLSRAGILVALKASTVEVRNAK